MAIILSSLAKLANDYTVFNKDQVLSDEQLNSLSKYFDDQDRLTRVNLIGVGLVCGCNIEMQGNSIVMSKGLAITTDGDLINIEKATSYSAFKPFGIDQPKYNRFYINKTKMLTLFELVQNEVGDSLTKPIKNFSTSSGFQLSDMVALLFQQTYIKDHDLCTGTDCDNHSQNYITKTKVLLVPQSEVKLLAPKIQTAHNVAKLFPRIDMPRVIFNKSRSTVKKVIAEYKKQNNLAINQLGKTLPLLWKHAGFLMSTSMRSDLSSSWIQTMKSINQSFSNTDGNVQYFYSFLQDLCEVWNELKEVMLSDKSLCSPATNAFEKHILLGQILGIRNSRITPNINLGTRDTIRLDTGIDLNPFDLDNFIIERSSLAKSVIRHGFYPSGAQQQDSQRARIQFLIHKLNALISEFTVPKTGDIKITPSLCRTHPQSKRAIPWYFRLSVNSRTLKFWNFSTYQTNDLPSLSSYHSDETGAKGAAAQPLAFNIEDKDFFRIEGHIGKKATEVQAELEKTRLEFNLPFSIVSILLDKDSRRLIGKTGTGYSDLHRLHALYRKDLVFRLDEVKDFSLGFKNKLFTSVDNGDVTDDDCNDSIGVKTLATSRMADVEVGVKEVKVGLDLGYQAYKKNTAWIGSFNQLMTKSTQFKSDFGKVAKTEFSTPVDGLIVDSKPRWLPWLDVIIKDKDDKADTKKMFETFVNNHPGLESTGGVRRGGTFVIVYDDKGHVVSDLSLSKCIEEKIEVESEPVLPRPITGPFINNGINIYKSPRNFVNGKINDFSSRFTEEIQSKFNVGTAYASAMRDSINVLSTSFIRPDLGVLAPGNVIGTGPNILLPGLVKDREILISKTRELELLKLSEVSASPAEKQRLAPEIKKVEDEMSADMKAILIKISTADNTISSTDIAEALNTVELSNKTVGAATKLNDSELTSARKIVDARFT
ncbi:hypothetical protein [Candidatus Colwellia aromaticivorans]|uniref:hypothetical protein n=1 Tax=Candidatus Colwellia aromaticivorans TaxID=2267621 RepID=UPI000DF1D4D4|nr:hypothetical protein [Candidatus Colwellia aromaticivorans]